MDRENKKITSFGEVLDVMHGEIIDMNENKDTSINKTGTFLIPPKKKCWGKTTILSITLLVLLVCISTFFHAILNRQKF